MILTVAAHCTGIEATVRLRHDLGLTRQTAGVGATGASFSLASGIAPGRSPLNEQAAANSRPLVWVLRQRLRHGGMSTIRQNCYFSRYCVASDTYYYVALEMCRALYEYDSINRCRNLLPVDTSATSVV
jgi:hypothetical protein